MKALSGQELCRILEKKGWALARTRGAHFTYEKEGDPSITVVS